MCGAGAKNGTLTFADKTFADGAVKIGISPWVLYEVIEYYIPFNSL